MAIQIPDALLERIRTALRAGNKIEAIKLMREQRPELGLSEAKEFVENLDLDGPPGPAAAPPVLRGDSATVNVPVGVREALLEGKKVEAIRRYRESVPGTGLADAKTLVDKIEADLQRLEPGRFAQRPVGQGCLGVLCFGLASLIVIAWLASMAA